MSADARSPHGQVLSEWFNYAVNSNILFTQCTVHLMIMSRHTSACLSEEAGRHLLAVNDEEVSELIGREVCLLFDKGAHSVNLGLS